MPLAAIVVCAFVVFTLLTAGTRARWFPTTRNFEGYPVAVAGIALVAGILAGLALTVLHPVPGAMATGAAAAGFGALGALDDRYGSRSTSGFRGHLLAAARGEFTTGFWKIIGGGLTALVAAWLIQRPHDGVAILLPRAAVIALSANAWNLLDTRPVRAVALFLALATPLALVLRVNMIWTPIAGAAMFLPWDRRRLVMLGDAGSNVLGAVWGAGIAMVASPWALAVVLGLLIALNIYTERRSLNAEISARPWLSRLDVALRGAGPKRGEEE